MYVPIVYGFLPEIIVFVFDEPSVHVCVRACDNVFFLGAAHLCTKPSMVHISLFGRKTVLLIFKILPCVKGSY